MPFVDWDERPETACDVAVQILQATHDGADLAPHDLALVQRMVNASSFGGSEALEVAFDDLYQRVKRGYQEPWLHGVQNLTIDHEGYVYWKGVQVEHFDLPWAYTKRVPRGYDGSGRASAVVTARRCELLESIGVEVNSRTVVWKWTQELQELYDKKWGLA